MVGRELQVNEAQVILSPGQDGSADLSLISGLERIQEMTARFDISHIELITTSVQPATNMELNIDKAVEGQNKN